MPTQHRSHERLPRGWGIPIGAGVGAGTGLILGMMLDQLALGLALGTAFGLLWGNVATMSQDIPAERRRIATASAMAILAAGAVVVLAVLLR